MADKENPIHSFNANSNTGVKVYKNRAVFTEGNLFKSNEQVVLFRNIVSIELSGLTQKFVIHTQAGKLEIGWLRGPFAKKVRDVILENID